MMIEYAEAFRLVMANVPRLRTQILPVEQTIGYILAQDISSPLEMPPFNKSAVDGYALIAHDTARPLVILKGQGKIKAGELSRTTVKRGQCLKIMTGSPLPRGADSVVMIENTRPSGEEIEVLVQVKKGENVCKRAEDIKRGEVVLKKGTRLNAASTAVAAALGKKELLVYKKPEVSILSTGNEIVKPGQRLIRGSIYDSNGAMLSALLEKEGISYEFIGMAKDKITDLERRIKAGLKKDMVLISGGVSMGDYDLVPRVLASFKVKKIFHKVKIKPGKPVFFGRLGEKLIFGIPGNPVSNLVVFYLFIKPAMERWSGRVTRGPHFARGILTRDFRQKTGRCHFVLVKIKKDNNNFYLYPVSSHGSADILAAARADGFMKVDGRYAFLKKGESLEFISWSTE